MLKRFRFLRWSAIYPLSIPCLFLICGSSAFAEEVAPSAVPSDPNADSIAAMKDTVRDPRIRHAVAEYDGLWKVAVPQTKMDGGFENHDPIGLVAGKLIPADCSLNWIDPDTHKLYCFTSATSLVYFLNAPQTYLMEAQKTGSI